jgi:hypothetical protein
LLIRVLELLGRLRWMSDECDQILNELVAKLDVGLCRDRTVLVTVIKRFRWVRLGLATMGRLLEMRSEGGVDG